MPRPGALAEDSSAAPTASPRSGGFARHTALRAGSAGGSAPRSAQTPSAPSRRSSPPSTHTQRTPWDPNNPLPCASKNLVEKRAGPPPQQTPLFECATNDRIAAANPRRPLHSTPRVNSEGRQSLSRVVAAGRTQDVRPQG